MFARQRYLPVTFYLPTIGVPLSIQQLENLKMDLVKVQASSPIYRLRLNEDTKH